MSENIIGLHIYSLTLHKTQKPEKVPLTETGTGSEIKRCLPQFTEHYSQQYDGGNDAARTWFLDVREELENVSEGLIMYGSSGFESDIVDRNTKQLNYQRKVTDVDVIPLYYKIWVPNEGEYGLMALQTFGLRSCVGRFQEAFRSFFKAKNDGLRIIFTPIVPNNLPNFSSGEVKKLSLIKHDYSTDTAENQLGSRDELVDLDVTFRAKPKGSLGILSEFNRRVGRNNGKEVLTYKDTEFDEATAEVQIGKRRRRVTLIGVSKNSGKFDLTQDVVRGANGHPEFSSIGAEVESLFEGLVIGE